jgi:hypothetical protein
MVFPYLKGFDIIKCGFYIFHLVFVLNICGVFVFKYLVLNKWYQSTFLGKKCGKFFFFIFADFFGEEKEGRDILDNFCIFL